MSNEPKSDIIVPAFNQTGNEHKILLKTQILLVKFLFEQKLHRILIIQTPKITEMEMEMPVTTVTIHLLNKNTN